ncbi:MAG: hypothetical protein LAN63_08535 [Acidobacteriia bacterium]|nr:hypothetical protein [Terriglobia bacterium]
MQTSNKTRARKIRVQTKFQADLAPSDASTLQRLKQELEVRSNADFLAEAVALIRWAVSERSRGCAIVSESASGEKRVLVSPRLERVAPEQLLPHVEINWSKEQLESFGQLASGPPAAPKRALVDLMKQKP